ncbi:MAG: glycoside hydrolase family 16 protein [Acidobacteriaceae bacterium]|nr:glycoside hydrolase family 16 protein [Acidobacteriaceae bacterium]MBV9780219.1 glycoside hydrolase family 16 protein [Acidobacteriaceae bacterium]
MRNGLVFILLFIALPVHAQTDWKLVWSDEFDGARNTGPDLSKWTFDLGGGGFGNRELEIYTNKTENIFNDGQGHLVIRAVKERSGSFTSARIKTEGRFTVKYGKIQARIKIPSGQGMWPAFWMLGDDIGKAGWPDCGEIDVMENIGREPSTVHGTVHGPRYSGKDGITSQYSLPDGSALSRDFHIYSAVWSSGSITFLLDGKTYGTVTPGSLPRGAKWVFDHPFFILLNLAVGGTWPGNPDKTSQFPQEMVIDWVRVWQAAR